MSVKPQMVTLTAPEVHFALALATQRDACKQDREARLSRKHSGFGVHFAGVIGELCFRKVHGGKLNTDVLPNGDRHAADVTLPDGRQVEIKTSLYAGADVELKFEREEFNCMTYCSLVQVTLPDCGAVYPIWSQQDIRLRVTEKDYGFGPRLVFKP